MKLKACYVCMGLVLMAATAAAQTTVTTSGGTTNAVPVFTGNSTLGNSNITEVNGNVGIGTTSPSASLDVNGSFVLGHTEGGTAYSIGFTRTAGPMLYDSAGSALTLGGTVSSKAMTILANGNVGIGTMGPIERLDVGGGMLHVGGQVNPTTVDQGAYLGWNALTGGWGETDFINNPGSGYGGFAFMETPPSGSPRTTLMFLNAANGNLGIGTTNPSAKLEVDGNIKLTAGSGGSIVFPDGTVQGTAYTGVACGGDYAEAVNVTGERRHYDPGDLLVLDPKHPGDVLKSAKAYSTMIAGIYSTKPGFVGRRMKGPKGPNEVPMAMVGIVPTHVTAENGPIHVGDLLVSSSIPGYAMKGTDRSRMLGAVVGKAMGNLASGKGEIEVLVTLQ